MLGGFAMFFNKIIIVQLLFLLVACSSKEKIISKNNNLYEELSPLSFAIFEDINPFLMSIRPINIIDLLELDRTVLRITQDSTNNESIYFIYVVYMGSINHLYNKKQWNDIDKNMAIKVSFVLSKLSNNPSLKINGRDNRSFIDGLLRLKRWFISESNKDDVLANMLFHLDTGVPLFGEELDKESKIQLKRMVNIELTNKKSYIEILIDSVDNLILSHVLNDGSTQWIKRLTGSVATGQKARDHAGKRVLTPPAA